MIYGIGIDIVMTGRIRIAVERWGKRFLDRVFTEREVSYAFSIKDPYLPLAVRFAAKEAFIKAIRSEIHVPLRDVEVMNQDDGSPLLSVKGKVRGFLDERSIDIIHVSLSHEKDYGIACVILEGKQ
jgi:holo-[acyl-carrier protein] synthase